MKIALLFIMMAAFSQVSFSQTTQKIKVNGVCNSCKKKIETAAKDAGASYALWNKDNKILTVKYASNTSSEKIEESVAHAGYDTQNIKATDEAYKKLESCCQYDRTAKTGGKKKGKKETCD